MSNASAVAYAKKALEILERDARRLGRIDKYATGDHDRPYMPETADAEFKALAERSVTNWMPTLIDTPNQALFVDNFRVDLEEVETARNSPAWLHWKHSRLDGRQSVIYHSALKFGHSFVLTERDPKTKKIVSKGLSTLRTVALYEDPATDVDPVAGVYFRRWATGDDSAKSGLVYVWDDARKYTIVYTQNGKWRVTKSELHGASECPLTRFAAYVDLEGRTWGVVEPMIPIQDRVNQTIFDLLINQTYTSFQVRTVTGMAPPMKMVKNEETGEYEPELDANGEPVPDHMYLNAARWFYAEDKDAKFGSLPGGDLTGFIKAAELGVRHMSALSQTPPHFLLGEIANISAEALEAAETALSRKIEALRTTFGESWERVFRIFHQVNGDAVNGDSYDGEVIWRDLGASSLAQSADALGKFAEALGIPKRGLWGRVPKASKGELAYWERLRQEDDYERQIIENAVGRTTPTRTPTNQTSFAGTAREVTNGSATTG